MSEFRMTIMQAAILKGMSSNGIQQAIREGKLQVEKRNRINYLREEDVIQYEPTERQLSWRQKKPEARVKT